LESNCVWPQKEHTRSPASVRLEDKAHGSQIPGSQFCGGWDIRFVRIPPFPLPESLPLKRSPACGACPTPITCQTTAFTCVFRCFPCDPSCGSASWATPEFTQRSVAPMVKMTRSKTFQAYLPSCHRTYSCIHCRAHLANHDELISKSFQGSQGRAYLFNSVVNVGCGPAEERVLLTGLHAVADIYCENCKTTLGWKYEHAFESSQKYKEGKYIIELAHMIKDNGWD
ncbi:yippee-like 2, partial [Columba livia]